LTIRRAGRNPFDVTLTRATIRIQSVRSHLIGDDIGYIRITSFSEQTDQGLGEAMKSLKDKAGGKLRGVVLDLRNNPGGLLDQAVAVSNAFLDQGEIVSTRGRHADDAQRFDARPGADIAAGLPLAVLINGGSASASEIVAGALQDHHRAVLLGSRSFGKGSVQTIIPLPGHGAMRLTTARYYTPSGRSIQGLGIAPDVEVDSARTEQPHFGPDRESELKGAISNVGGTPQNTAPPRTDLPPIAHDIPKLPPEKWPTYDPTKPDTDFQLQQALVVVRGMPVSRRASR